MINKCKRCKRKFENKNKVNYCFACGIDLNLDDGKDWEYMIPKCDNCKKREAYCFISHKGRKQLCYLCHRMYILSNLRYHINTYGFIAVVDMFFGYDDCDICNKPITIYDFWKHLHWFRSRR